MVARGDYIFNQGTQINMVDGGDVGQYVIKIMPNMSMSTLCLKVKTYYCDMAGTPRTRFFDVFPWAAFLKHSWRLVTSNKTLEELNAEDDNDNDNEEQHGEISLEHDSQDYISGLQYVGDGEYMYADPDMPDYDSDPL
jgi:hypothetical protein